MSKVPVRPLPVATGRVKYLSGVPVAPGWYPTRVNATSPATMRWFDGKEWSVGVSYNTNLASEEHLNRLAARKASSSVQPRIRWGAELPAWWAARKPAGSGA